MDTIKSVIEIVDKNLIYLLVPIILILMFVKRIFKNRFETRKALNLIRWTIIIYALITFTLYLVGMVINPYKYTFINRATGPYAYTYWLMLFGAFILPLTLFFKKLASNFWFVLFVAFGLKIGMYFERFVIMTSSLHSDYQTEIGNAKLMKPISYEIGILLLQSIVFVIVILGILEMIKK